MSEGIKGQEYRNQQINLIETSRLESRVDRVALEGLSGRSSSLPRAGACLVEAYATLVREKETKLAPDKVLFEYLKFLTSHIDKKKPQSSFEEALALLNSVELLIRHHSLASLTTSLKSEIARILKSYPSLAEEKESYTEVVDKLLGAEGGSWAFELSIMDPSHSNTPMTSWASGIAERLALSDDPSTGISNILSELGPSCTRSASTFREVLASVARTNGSLNEASLAGLIYFFSDKSGEAANNAAGLSSALLGSVLSGRGLEGFSTGWKVETVAQVLSEDYSSLDWTAVARNFDFPSFNLKDTTQFRALLDLYRAGAKCTPPLAALTEAWRNTSGQLSILEALVAVPPTVYMVPLDDEELADAATAPPPGPQSAPNPQCWASMQILRRLLYLSDAPSLYRRVRDLFVRCLLSCPEVLLCSLVRLQLKVANAAAQRQPGGEALASIGTQIKTELMRELIPLFFRPNARHRVQNGPAAIRRLYAISPSTVMAACFEAWRSTAQEIPQLRLATVIHVISIARLLPSPADAVASLLSGNRDAEYSIAIAFVMSDNDYLQLKPWLAEKLMSKDTVGLFAVALVSYLRKTFSSAAPKGRVQDGSTGPLVSLENVAISLQLLQSLDSSIVMQSVSSSDGSLTSGTTLGENIRALADACLSTHPTLRNTLTSQVPSSGSSIGSGPTQPPPDDVEEMATAYFQKIYTSEQSIGEVVEMLKRFKNSGNSKENDIFACMVHNLFDEYRFFSKYPDKELRITGILFGQLIQEQLVNSITLGIALRYVLEALRKTPSPPNTTTSSGKMFNFGMFALEQFKGRLHEWPQYCSHIVQIPHLKEGYKQLVSEIEREMALSRGGASSGGSSSQSGTSTPAPDAASGSLLVVDQNVRSIQPQAQVEIPSTTLAIEKKPVVAVFGPKLGRAVTEGFDEEKEFEAPPGSILDRVQFLVNNLAPSNVEMKAQELKEMLDPKYFDWLGHFLVVKRISTQANFHGLYLSFLDNLGDYGKGLVESIISSVYHNIGKLLRSPKITTSSSERSYLKNLGIWLGQITLARNRPMLQIMLDCKELLLQGYETGKLIAVAPFLAKTLEGAKNSIVFRPPNPWLMGILGVFRSVYNVEGLKMNIKFEVEVLCKNLGIKLEDIPLRDEVLAKRIAPVKERNPDFNIKATQKPVASAPGIQRPPVSSPEVKSSGTDSGRSTPSATEQQETVIPNLAAYVTVNASLPQLLQAQGGPVLSNVNMTSLKRWVPLAVDRAIREIIQPVVERSVTIACITTKEIVTKDFAMESDESKMRKAGQLMVANLAGSLALVTCREPLRSSISTHLRQLLTSTLGRADKLGEQEQNVIEQCVQICATDNLELGCMLIEKAATEKAVRDVDESLAAAIAARRNHREQTGQPFYDMSIFNTKQRYPGALPEPLRPKPGSLRPELYQQYESFQRLPRQNQVLGSVPSSSTSAASTRTALTSNISTAENETGSAVKVVPAQQLGSDVLASLAARLDAAVTAVLTAPGVQASDIKLAMLPPNQQIRQLLGAVKQLMPNANAAGGVSRPLAPSEQDVVLGFSQGIFKRLYELSLAEPLRLEVLVSLLQNINAFCPKLGKDLGTWATYAPTNTEQQRRLHRTVLLLLVRSRLLAVHDLDTFLAARADQGRNNIWLEFSLLFIRTAFMERISLPSDFPKLMDLMTRVAEGRSQASPQISQTYRKPILRMLEETRTSVSLGDSSPIVRGSTALSSAPDVRLESSSSISKESLAAFSQASQRVAEATEAMAAKDPASARQQVMALLDGWIRLQTDQSGNEKPVAQYLQVLQQFGVGKSEELTERFLRLSTVVIVEAVLKPAATGGEGTKTVLNYSAVDLYAKLLVLLFRHMNSGGQQQQIDAQRLNFLNKILGSIVRTMFWHSEKSKSTAPTSSWDQRPWFRLMMNLIMDINKPDPSLESIRPGTLTLFGAALHTCQPLALPQFAFSWLELVSHRHFLPNVLLYPNQKLWHIMHNLVVDQLLFLEPYLRRIELPPAVKKLYEGTLRVVLVLLHDFPSFLAGYHLSLCNVIPESCVQLRNIILSATPKGISPPDPFTPNLKIDLMPEISQSPPILSSVLSPIEKIRPHLDGYLKDGSRSNFLQSLLPLLQRDDSDGVDVPRVSSLVLYVGAHAIARLQNSQISLSRTPEIELFQKLMELDDRGRYICLNAIANQLRYPSSHTHYFSCVMLYIFSESKSAAVKEQVTRVLLERLIVNRPHPWGMLITFIELIKNQRYGFWNYPFTRCATEIEKVFESVARSCMPPGTQRPGIVGGEDR